MRKTIKFHAVYDVRGHLTMEKYYEIMAHARERNLPRPVRIIATSNCGPNGSPNYVFEAK